MKTKLQEQKRKINYLLLKNKYKRVQDIKENRVAEVDSDHSLVRLR